MIDTKLTLRKIKELGEPELHKIVKFITFFRGQKKMGVAPELLEMARFYPLEGLEWVGQLLRRIERKHYSLVSSPLPYPIYKEDVLKLKRKIENPSIQRKMDLKGGERG